MIWVMAVRMNVEREGCTGHVSAGSLRDALLRGYHSVALNTSRGQAHGVHLLMRIALEFVTSRPRKCFLPGNCTGELREKYLPQFPRMCIHCRKTDQKNGREKEVKSSKMNREIKAGIEAWRGCMSIDSRKEPDQTM